MGNKAHSGRAGRFVLATLSGVIAQASQVAAIPTATQSEQTIPRLADLEPMQTGAQGLFESPVAQAEPGTQKPPTSPEDLDEVTVTGTRSYRRSRSSTATKTDTAILDVPQSIQVIPRQVLEDQRIVRAGDALQNVSGIVNLGSYSGYSDSLLIRGFEAAGFDGSFFRDGVPYFQFDYVETADLERIEVLKGPASVLFGQGQPGGIVNLVSKQPQAKPYYSAALTAGSYSDYRGQLDLSGPLNAGGTLQYRLNAFYQNARSFRDFVRNDRSVLTPALTWQISPQTALRFDSYFINEARTMDDGIPVIGRSVANVPIGRFLHEPFSNYRKDEYGLGYSLDHRFSENWSLRHTARYQNVSPERYYPFSLELNEQTGELSRLAYWAAGNYNRIFANADVVGRFNTGSIAHRLLFGVEYRRGRESPIFKTSELYPSINIFNPVYIDQAYAKTPDFFRDDDATTLAAYIQDQIDLLPNLKLLAGVRFDTYRQSRSENDLNQPRSVFVQTDGAWSPRVGLVWQPAPEVSLYGSYTRSFVPQFGTFRNFNGAAFRPETGTQWEVGVKTELFDKKLSLTLAAYDLRKQNVVTADPTNPLVSIQTGEQTSRGIEFDASGEILPGWNVIASYSLIDAVVSADNSLPVGNTLANVPANTASFWSRYNLQGGDLKGLGFGLGLFYVDSRPGDLLGSFTLDSYVRTDAALYYRPGNWQAALNFRNLFDVRYYTGGFRTGVQPGAPFTVLGTLSMEL